MIKSLLAFKWIDKWYPQQDLLIPPTHKKEFSFSNAEVAILKGTLAVVLFFSVFDIWHDLISNSSYPHLATDFFLSMTIVFGLWILLNRAQRNDKNITKLQNAYFTAQKDAETHASEKSLILKGFGECIDVQLGKWKLTHAEKEIALLLLKGLSHNEIAEIRNTSERTVRQQSLNVYAKSGVKGRSDLAAFFLEDILNASPPSNTQTKA